MCDHHVSIDVSHHASHDVSHHASHDVGHHTSHHVGHHAGHVNHHHHSHGVGHHASHQNHSHSHHRSGHRGGARHHPAGTHDHRHHDAWHRHHHNRHGHRRHGAADDDFLFAFGNPWYVPDAPVLPGTLVQRPQRRPRRSELIVIGGGEFPSIGKISIHIPSDSIVQQGSVTYFAIDVVPEEPAEAPWRVFRRYSQFRVLQDKIHIAAAFPGKHFFGCKGWKLEARREGLQTWLQAAVSSPTALLQPGLRKFLLVGRSPIPLADMPQPSAPPPQEDDGLILLLVELPAHIGFGDVIAVEVPNGKVKISVPFGLSPGKPLQLWYDPTAGTLALHHEQQWQALQYSPQK
eukprot:TRINITY_DN2702_c0_g1_i4.p1 TRINITY_DN2702_c0_g1~~TRINITY_DN2702_c0_g1_i4.p1  ORF type:complete len:347 (-),score=37.57 TRINITY_DN2702_c0_g1_i4:168-1208(-)